MKYGQTSLRHQLKIQATQIEEVLNRHDVKGQIKGEPVSSRFAHFDLQTQLAAGWQRFLALKSELVTSLGIPDVKLIREGEQIRVTVRQPNPHPVNLLELIDSIPNLAKHTAVLGIDDDERPLLLNLMAPDVTNVLVAGGPGAGKSSLLRSLALSLALTNRQSNVQLVIFDGPSSPDQTFTSQLYPLSYLPHMMFPIVESVEDAADSLVFLADEVAYRQKQPISDPLVVILIDNVDQLILEGGAPVQEPLIYLLQEGPAAGIRLVLAAGEPGVPELRPLLIGHVPIRLVGQVADARQARLATGRPESQAEYLLGRGDFLAAAYDSIVPFQVAYVGDYDLHLTLEKLYENSYRATMLAQILNQSGQPTMAPPVVEDGQIQDSDETAQTQRNTVHETISDLSDPYAKSTPVDQKSQEGLIEDLSDSPSKPHEKNLDVNKRIELSSDSEKSQGWSDAFVEFLSSKDFDRPISQRELTSRNEDDEKTDVVIPRKTKDPHGSDGEVNVQQGGQARPKGPSAPAEHNAISPKQETTDDWDDFWHNDDYWHDSAKPGPQGPEVIQQELESEDRASELIYEDIDDDFGAMGEEEDNQFSSIDEEE